MSTKRILSIVLAASAVMLAVGIGLRVTNTARELTICQPRLVIGLGERVYRLMHGSDDLDSVA